MGLLYLCYIVVVAFPYTFAYEFTERFAARSLSRLGNDLHRLHYTRAVLLQIALGLETLLIGRNAGYIFYRRGFVSLGSSQKRMGVG